jgi:hypothetical protein
VHHQRVHDTFHDWALRLSESLRRVSTGGVWDKGGIFWFHGDVIFERNIVDLLFIEEEMNWLVL